MLKGLLFRSSRGQPNHYIFFPAFVFVGHWIYASSQRYAKAETAANR